MVAVRLVLLTEVLQLALDPVGAYRTNNGTVVDREIHKTDEIITDASPYFNPYNEGFVGTYGEPANVQRERINEGAPGTPENRRISSLAGSEGQ